MQREQVIRQIVQRDVLGRSLLAELVQSEDPLLYQAASDLFGTWETALQYSGTCGLRASHDGSISRVEICRQIRRLCTNGVNLTATRIRKRDRRFYDTARQLFGSWNQALEAAGVNVHQHVASTKGRRLSREEILVALREYHAAGHPLSWALACLENRALALSAKYAFSGWRRALAAAGIPPEELVPLVPRKWNRERVIEAIRQLHSEGKPLGHAYVQNHFRGLTSAAQRYCGGWPAALKAAGIVEAD